MTFFFRKFDAFHRTRAGTRVRNGLRRTVSGVACAGRLTVCLLLAGFLGVVSAMVQPHVLRAGGGAVTEATQSVHHYVIGDGEAMTPSRANGFLAGGTALRPDVRSVKDVFTMTVVTRTPPRAVIAIGDKEVIADSAALVFDLEDLNGDEAGEPKAFSDPAQGGLTYTLEPEDDIATITVNGSMVTITPVWRAGDDSTRVKVTATNALGADSVPTSFGLKVLSARKPIVNPDLAAFLPSLGAIEMTVGELRSWDLMNITDAKEKKDYKPLFIDPNVADNDALPGGLLYKIRVEDVEAPHRFDNISSENNVYTSGGRVTLDSVSAMLTIAATAPNYMNVTVWAVDREDRMTSATMMVTVAGVTSAEGEELPTEVGLSRNYPNPFNPQTTIDYALPQAGNVRLVVYDMLGREVDVLIDGPQDAGRHTVRFGANHLPNGAYVYRLAAGDKTITRTMVLVK